MKMSPSRIRAFRYYARKVQLYVLLCIGLSLALGVYFRILNSEEYWDIYDVIRNMLWMLPYTLIIDNTAWGFYSISYYDSIALSFSAKRSDLFLGENLWQLLLIAEVSVVEVILAIFCAETAQLLPYFMFCGISLVIGVLCRMFSSVQAKYGKTLYVIILVLMAVGGSTLSVIFINNASFLRSDQIIFLRHYIYPIGIGISLLLYVILNIFNKKNYDHMMVR